MNFRDVEKTLKRTFKRKVSYSTALLVAFLISGKAVKAVKSVKSVENNQIELLNKINPEKEKINPDPEEDKLEKLISEKKIYSKFSGESHEIFFFVNVEDNGRKKNKTNSKFYETINLADAAEKNGIDEINQRNGVIIDDEPFRDEVYLGVNIKAYDPVTPKITPRVGVGSIGVPNAVIKDLSATAPNINSPVPPNIVLGSLPSIAAPLDTNITVNSPNTINKITITPLNITVPSVPNVIDVVVNKPAAPGGYDPTMIVIPTEPTAPTIIAPSIILASLSTTSSGNGDGSWFWDEGGANGVISQVIMSSGNWDINIGGSGTKDPWTGTITNYTASMPSGYPASSITGASYTGTNIGGEKAGIYRIVGSPYSSFGENTIVNIDATSRTGTNLRQFIHYDPHGDQSALISSISDASASERNEARSILDKYASSSRNERSQILALNGSINLTGNAMNIVGLQGHANNGRDAFILNTGEITVDGDNNAIFAYTTDGDPETRNFITSNYGTGDIKITGGRGNFVSLFDKNTTYTNHIHSFKNDANIDIQGGNQNVGVYVKRMANGGTLDLMTPIIISGGNQNVGVVQESGSLNNLNTQSVVKVDITGGTSNIGIYGKNSQTISATTVNITGGDDGIGAIASNSAALNIGSGNINITDGTQNIALYTDGGNITTGGNINITGADKNAAAVATGGNSIDINGDVNVGNISTGKFISNSIPLYAEGTGSRIGIVNDRLKLNLNGESTGLFALNGARITANRSVSPVTSLAAGSTEIEGPAGEADINIVGTINQGSVKGSAVFANNGGTVELKNTYIKVTDGSVGVASLGTGSNIDLGGGIVDYDGNAYAIYSDGVGAVNLTNGEIVLRGNSTGFEMDLSGSNPINLQNGRITMMSNDAVAVNLKNSAGTAFNISTLQNDINAATGGMTVVSGKDGSIVYDKYKIAAVDGGALNIDENLNKSSNDVNSAGHFYYRRFLGQRLATNVEDGITVDSTIDTALADEYFKGQVVGLEANSSALATGSNETQINVGNGSKIISDRSDSGSGAIGAYINYGYITLSAGSSIEVEQGLNSVNENGVGIYSVNGSKIRANGDITVDGNHGIGILGLAYREGDNGSLVVDEFGNSALDQGKIDIKNTGDINLTGEGSIGVYANNNKVGGITADSIVNNTGNIVIGSSSAAASSIGIYALNSIISNTGNITTGIEGIGIYGESGSEISSLGTITLGKDSIAVLADGSSAITDTSMILESNGSTDEKGKTGIYYKGTGVENNSLNVTMDGKDLENLKLIRVDEMDLISNGNLKVGTEGIGIYLNKGEVINRGIIELFTGKTDSTGMYTSDGTIINEGTITNNSSSIGMFAQGTDSAIINRGTINLDSDNGVALFVKDKAVTNLSGTGINFNSSGNLGIYSDNANVSLDISNINYSSSNNDGNILIYAKGGSEVTNNSNLEIDGISSAVNSGNKFVGVYLENNSLVNKYIESGSVSVKNEAIGLYSKGYNDLHLNITADGDGTTGVFVDNGSLIKGDVTAKNGAIGVYGSEGVVEIDPSGISLNITANSGTGMYLTDGANVSGGKITLTNTAGRNNIGLYYSKGSGIKSLNSSNLEILTDSTVGIYAAEGVDLENNGSILASNQNGIIGAFVDGGAKYKNNSDINISGNNAVGIYTGDGEAVNDGTISINGISGNTAIGMAVKTGSNGIIINNSRIDVVNGTGVYLSDSASFDGRGGTIKVSGQGIGAYIKNNSGGKVSGLGNLELDSNSVGIYSDSSTIDFDIDATIGNGLVGLVAKNSSSISGNINVGDGSLGAYILDETVSFNGSEIITGNKDTSGNSSVGVLLAKNVSPYNLNNLTIGVGDGVGIYLNNDLTTGADLTFSGEITTNGGTGIYIGENSTLTAKESTINVNSGTGIYLDGGAANIGTAGETVTLNLGGSGSVGIYAKSGTFNLGSDLTVTGEGSLIATKDGTLNSGTNISIGENSIGLLGDYTSSASTDQQILNSGTVDVTNGGIGLAVHFDHVDIPSGTVTIKNTGLLKTGGKSSSGNSSIGIYSEGADIENTGIIEVKSEGIGLFYNGKTAGKINNSTINLAENNSTGMYITGDISSINSGDISSIFEHNLGINLKNLNLLNTNIGNVNLGNKSIGISASGTTTNLEGRISTANGSEDKASIGLVVNANGNITGGNNLHISTGNNGVAAYVHQSSLSLNNLKNISVGDDGVFVYAANSSSVSLNDSLDVIGDKIGIISSGNSDITLADGEKITVANGGIGVVYKDYTNPIADNLNIVVESGIEGLNPGDTDYSIGAYFDNVSDIGSAATVIQNGNFSTGIVLNNSSGQVTGLGLDLNNSSYTDQIGAIVQNNSSLTVSGNILTDGDKNMGIYATGSNITVNGDLLLGDSNYSSDKSKSSIGVYLNDSNYTGVGSISTGDNIIGLYAEELSGTLSQSGNIILGDNSLGIYASNSSDSATGNLNYTGDNITIGSQGSIGFYGKNIDMSLTASNEINIRSGTSLGALSEGNGDISYSGNVVIEDKEDSHLPSIGIYKKNGSGTITTDGGTWNLGSGSYGIYLKQENGGSAAVDNSADMNLGKSSIGIFSSGKNTLNNKGIITTGSTDLGASGTHSNLKEHLNSVGLYLTDGTEAVNSGTIIVHEEHSVGVYSDHENSIFRNKGTIDVDSGGIGILVRNGAQAVNEGTVSVGSTLAPGGSTSIGMAAYAGGTIINSDSGIINVSEGAGMLVTQSSALENHGIINVDNGHGIQGRGTVVNTGTINVTGSGADQDTSTGTADIGSVLIQPDGTVYIDGKYVSIGGTLAASGAIIVDGAYVDITTNTPIFEANSVNGEINLLPNFALTGNGISYKVEDFLSTVIDTENISKITPITSPLFIAKVNEDEDLIIVKKPYKDLTIGNQFDNLEDGLDNILSNNPNDETGKALKNLNTYLEGLPDYKFSAETSRILSETRGDIYSTTQERMNNIDKAFDNSFEELIASPNTAKENNKYSIMYTSGNFSDPTIGVTDYDYSLKGILYMKDIENSIYENKYGFSLGIAGTHFNFKNDRSEEDVYSLKAGLHNVKSFMGDQLIFTTKLEFGSNRHETMREMSLDKVYENKAKFNTCFVNFDNELSKNYFKSPSSSLDLYTAFNLDLKKVSNFSEKGILELEIEENTYLSRKLIVGTKGSYKHYLNNNFSLKLKGNIKYSYDFEKNYNEISARLKNGEEGYYNLITPEEENGMFSTKLGLTLEKSDYMGATIEAEMISDDSRNQTTYNYSLRFNYTF